MATLETKQRFRPTQKAKPGKVVKRCPPSHHQPLSTSLLRHSCVHVSKCVWASRYRHGQATTTST